MSLRLLTDERSNAKLRKNASTNSGYRTSILYLAPASTAMAKHTVCPASTPGCRQACLFSAGRGAMAAVAKARINKTKWFLTARKSFLARLQEDLEQLSRRQTRTGIKQAIRLNGTSDIAWEKSPVTRAGQAFEGIPQAYPELQFYDYTKIPARALAQATSAWPTSYRLTFSRAESNERLAKTVASAGGNVAVVFRDKLPAEYLGRPVIDGTAHDQRFLDPQGVIVGLLAKGKAKQDTSGFVVN